MPIPEILAPVGGAEQLKGEEHDRIVLTVDLPGESPEAEAVAAKVRAFSGEDNLNVLARKL